MNAQTDLLKAGGSVLALAGTMAKLRARLNKKASDSAKKGYEKAANTKKENNELVKQNIEQVTVKKAPQHFGELARTEEEVPAVKGFEGPATQITAENTETKIPVDEDVKGLIEVKQKNLKRAAGGKRAAEKRTDLAILEAKKHNNLEIDYNRTKNYLEDMGFNKSAAEYKAVGLDKNELNSFAIAHGEEAGESWPTLIQTSFKNMKAKYSNNKDALDYLDIQEEAFQNKHGSFTNEDETDWDKDMDFQQLVIDFDKLVDDMKSGEYKNYMNNITGNNIELSPEEEETYKVWEDEIKTNRNFEGIVF